MRKFYLGAVPHRVHRDARYRFQRCDCWSLVGWLERVWVSLLG
jgi:hypothetical protein